MRAPPRLVLLATVLLACGHRTTPPASPSNRAATPAEDILTMTTEYQAQIAQHIAEFSATRRESPAIYAASELTQPDPYAPIQVTSEFRERSRERRVVLWGHLFCAIDPLRDPRFDPKAQPPVAKISIEDADMPPLKEDATHGSLVTIESLDPELQKKYRAREEQLLQQSVWFNEQFALYSLDRRITELAEEFFTSAFVRSAKSAAIVERCAESGHWAPARRAQVLAWVTPEE
jgi:hypothetical protein